MTGTGDQQGEGGLSRENLRCVPLSMCLLAFLFKTRISNQNFVNCEKMKLIEPLLLKIGLFFFSHHSLFQLEEELPLPEPMNSVVSNLMTKAPKPSPPVRSIAKVLPFLSIKYLPSYLQRAGSYTQLGCKECMEFHYWETWEVVRHGRTAHCACLALWI